MSKTEKFNLRKCFSNIKISEKLIINPNKKPMMNSLITGYELKPCSMRALITAPKEVNTVKMQIVFIFLLSRLVTIGWIHYDFFQC